MNSVDYSPQKADVPKSYELDSDCKYIRIGFRKNASLTEFDIPSVFVANVSDRQFYEIRGS